MENTELPITVYIKELRIRSYYVLLSFLLTFTVIYLNIEHFLYAMTYQLKKEIMYTNLTEAFFSYIQLALTISIYVMLPVIAYHCIKFITPALYASEYNAFILLQVVAYSCLTVGTYLTYTYIIPLSYHFFSGFESVPDALLTQEYTAGLTLQPKINELVSTITTFWITICLLCQIPTLVLILYWSKILSLKTLLSERKIIYFICLIIATLISPPDIASQICLTLPTICLYEITIWIIIYNNIPNVQTLYMETMGLEPITSCVQSKRSTN